MVKERLKLNEESSISTKVRFMAEEIRDILLRKLQYSPKYMSKESNCLIKKGNFAYKPKDIMNLEQFIVSYIVYYFDDEIEYEKFYKGNQEKLLSESDYEKNTIYYRFAIINDRIPKEFDGMIQHELSHFFQCCNGQAKNENLYKKITDVINNSKDKIDVNIAFALYLTFNTEIDAFVNQYYAYLKQNKIGIEEIINGFPNGEGSPYNQFVKFYNYVVDSEKYITDKHMKDIFGLNIEQIFKRLENADKRYKNKMMKVISLYKNKVFNKHISEVKNLNMSIAFGVRLNFELDCYQRGIYETESEFD